MAEHTISPSAPWPYWTEPLHIEVAGLDTAYRRNGVGAPLLYLHGAGLTRRWLPLYDQLARRFDVVVPEHPGFGDTPLPDWLEDFTDVVLHYAEMLDLLGLPKVDVVGHSLGGWIAAEFAAFYPERIRTLTLITPAGLRGSAKVDSFRLEPEESREILFNGQADRYPELFEEGDPVEAMVHGYSEKIAQARLMWNPRYDLRLERRLERVAAPAQVLLPDDDRLLDLDTMARYAELLPNATTRTISGGEVPTGHLLIVQEPEKLADAIAALIDAHS